MFIPEYHVFLFIWCLKTKVIFLKHTISVCYDLYYDLCYDLYVNKNILYGRYCAEHDVKLNDLSMYVNNIAIKIQTDAVI